MTQDYPTIVDQIKAFFVEAVLDGYKAPSWVLVHLGRHAYAQLQQEGCHPTEWSVYESPQQPKRSLSITVQYDGRYGYQTLTKELLLKPRPQSSCYTERLERKRQRKLKRRTHEQNHSTRPYRCQ